MKINSRIVFGALGLLVLLLAWSPAQAQDDMEAWMKLASPGENHKLLGNMVGDWTYSIKSWMAPDQPPMESTGTMHAEWILGGRYVSSVWKGAFMDMEFEGHGLDGYDNISKQYVSSWVDNMGTGIMQSAGTCDQAKNACTLMGTTMDPETGKEMKVKSVSEMKDKNTFHLEMYGIAPDGKEMKMMELTGTRKTK